MDPPLPRSLSKIDVGGVLALTSGELDIRLGDSPPYPPFEARVARIVYTDLSGNEQTVPFGPDHPVVTVGRATDCTIRSNRKSVSRRHAEFRYSNGQFEVIDLNSSNGTYLIINEERKPIIGREYLADSDEVWCGDFIIRFFEEDGAQAGYNGAGSQPPPPPQQGGWAQQQEEPTPPPRDHASFQTGPPSGGGVNFGGGANEVAFGGGHEVGFSDSLAEESSAAWTHEDDGPPTRQAGVDVQRLLAEKQSIEDLAARQANELEDLQARLEEARSSSSDDSAEELAKLREELEESQTEQSRLEARLHEAMQTAASNSDLKSELDELTRRNEQLDAEWRAANQRVEELTERLDSSAGQRDELEQLREANQAKERDIEALEQEIERLRDTMSELRERAEEAGETERAKEELESLRLELERHTRLAEEFERRNRDLQSELDELRESADNEDALASRVAELETELAEVRSERDEALESAEHERANEGALEDLRNEVEGLKRRLKMEKDRSAEAESEAAERIKMLEASLEAASSDEGGEGVDPELMKEASELVSNLGRIVDAIERADLDALSTVDRVRIQSALRDTEPKATLEKLIGIFSND